MTTDDWISAGYKRFEIPPKNKTINNNADFLLQKRFDDHVGKRYYITVFCYDRTAYPPPHNNGIGFMPTVQFVIESENKRPFFNIELNDFQDIATVEAWVHTLWDLFGRPYYEELE